MTDGVTDDTGLQPPTVATILARGFGWGLLLGAACGYVAVAIAMLVGEGVDAVALFYAVTFYGLAGAIGGAAYGTLVGGVVALALTPLRHREPSTAVVRLLGSLVGAVVVAAISFFLVSPDLSVGGDQLTSHAAVEAILFFVVPCCAAAALAYALSPRLLGPGGDVVEHHL